MLLLIKILNMNLLLKFAVQYIIPLPNHFLICTHSQIHIIGISLLYMIFSIPSFPIHLHLISLLILLSTYPNSLYHIHSINFIYPTLNILY